ncbi:MAG: Fe-S cluster assembly protein SufB [Bacillota bacterium]|nr:Fe-S cluster assembly protein SufB [Bacillota bacterium]
MKSAPVTKQEYQWGFRDPDDRYVYRGTKGLSREVVEEISRLKNEPDWMREFRLHALDVFLSKPMPTWGVDLSEIDFDQITYFMRAADRPGDDWSDVPEYIKKTFDRLGIPEAEKKWLGGVSAQYESEVVYHSIREDLKKKGVIFLDTDSAVREYPDLVREYFGTVVPPEDNKFAALNSAVWSGGSFIYVPKGVTVDIPLQAYFRINAERMGQFERTLIIVDEGAKVHYVEGCTAPTYSSESLHSAVVEIVAKAGASVRYTTIQNWSNNVYNLVTKRAVAYANATVEWIDGNLGSKVTMKYPSVYLMEPGAKADILSIAFAGKGQDQDAGGKAIHVAPYTTSTIRSKSISKDGGVTLFRGLVEVAPEAHHVRSSTKCDALILDEISKSDTVPTINVANDEVTIEHEATVSKLSEEQLFYLMSRGLTEEQAAHMIVMGFIEPFARALPMEYAVELNRLIEMEMEGAVG